MEPIEIKASEPFRNNTLTINVDIRIVKDWRFRLGFWLMRLGGWIMGLAVKKQEVNDV